MCSNHASLLVFITTIYNCVSQYQPTPLKSATLSPLNNNTNGASVSVMNADVSTSNVWTITTSTQIGWNLLLSLDNSWGFYPNAESSLQITINGESIHNEHDYLDLVLSYSVNNANFFSVYLSMDNNVNNRISPSCDINPDPSSTNVNSGNVNQIVSLDTANDRWTKASLDETWAGMRQGQKVQGYDNDWPLQFTLRNIPNIYGDDLFVSFTTPTWNTWSQNCGFSSFNTDSGLQMYIGSNNIDDEFIISSIAIEYGYQLTYPPTANPIDITGTPSPTVNTIPPSSDTLSPSSNTQSPTVNTLSPSSNTPTPTLITATPTNTGTSSPTVITLPPSSNTQSPSDDTSAPTSITLMPTQASITPTQVSITPTQVSITPTQVSITPTMNTASPTNNSPSPTINNNIQNPTINVRPSEKSNHGSGEEENEHDDIYTTTELFVNNKQHKVSDNDMSIVYIIIGVLVPLNIIACAIIAYCFWIKKKQQRFVDKDNEDKIKVESDIFGNSIDVNMNANNVTNEVETMDTAIPFQQTSFYATVASISNISPVPISPGESIMNHIIGVSQTEGFNIHKTGMNTNVNMNADIDMNATIIPGSLGNQFIQNRDTGKSVTVASINSDYDIGDVIHYTLNNDNNNNDNDINSNEYIDDNIITPGNNNGYIEKEHIELQSGEFIIDGDDDEEYLDKNVDIVYETPQ
eukprot:517659_1